MRTKAETRIGAAVTQQMYFAIPGDLRALTGGYGYDRRLLVELPKLGLLVEYLPLDGSFPFPDKQALQDADRAFAALPDQALVLVDGLAFGAMAQCASRHADRLRLVALCHHPLALESGLSAQQQQAFLESERVALQCARAVIVTSANTAHTLTELFALPRAKIYVAQPGTDRATFAPCTSQPPVLLSVATLTRRKAHDVLIGALAAVVDIPWQARFVGGEEFDPQWGAQLREQIAAAGLEGRISLLGSVEELAGEYLNADLFVLPSRYEGYGMVFAEALSYGLPIIAARTGAVADVVPETAGRLVPTEDTDALAQALRTVLTDRPLYESLRSGAQAAAQNLSTWQDTARIVFACLADITQLEERDT
jgi:glycosyltransferase involved in cell wall biosynthesis